MSESGWVSMHRGWADNPIFTQKDFCQRMAWYWLIENACWKSTKVRVGGKIIDLNRGQISYSRSFLSVAWGWTSSRVERFLNALQTEHMIVQGTEHGQRIITICNYNKYQDKEENSDRQSDSKPDSNRTANGHNKNKETSKQDNNSLFELSSINIEKSVKNCDPKEFEEFWSLYPRKEAKKSALKAFNSTRQKGTDHATIIAGVRKYAAVCIGKEPRYIKHPTTWINGGCWEDEHSGPDNSSFPAGIGANGAARGNGNRPEPRSVVAAALRVAARYDAQDEARLRSNGGI